MQTAAIDISSPLFKADPYPSYAQLRAERPVLPVKLPDGQTAWLITRYDDALSALKDRRFSKDKLNAGEKQPWLPAFFSRHSPATCLIWTIPITHVSAALYTGLHAEDGGEHAPEHRVADRGIA